MNVVLIGATGLSGKAVLKTLLDQNHIVTAVTRRASALQSEKARYPNLKIVEGSVLDAAFIQNVITHQDAVINCLGIGGKGNGKPNSLVSDATKILVDAMEKSEVKRLIAMSNVGAGDSRTFHPWFFRALILPYFMTWLKVIIEDKNRMETFIFDSKTDWTIVRCPNILDEPAKGKVTATLDGKGLKLSITNQDLAVFMVNQLNSNNFLRKSPSVSN